MEVVSVASEKEADPTGFPKPLSPLQPIGDSDSTAHAMFDDERFEIAFTESDVSIWPFDGGFIYMERDGVARLRDLFTDWLDLGSGS